MLPVVPVKAMGVQSQVYLEMPHFNELVTLLSPRFELRDGNTVGFVHEGVLYYTR